MDRGPRRPWPLGNSVKIPEALRPYMGGKDVIVPKH